jgi:TolB-like protein
MNGPSAPVPGAPTALPGFWDRLKEHKIAQWTLAYAAAAYTLLHVVEMVSEALEWPHVIARVLTLVLGLGFPIVITLAWYHGAKALKRVSGPELMIITILLLIAGSLLWALNRRGEHETASSTATASAWHASDATTAALRSVAVMPFANLTGDPSKEYLGDGMAEEVINSLANVPGLQVAARTSSFAYKGRNADIRQIGRDLNVSAVLEGSVRSAGNRIRITAQLINAQTGLHRWSQTYERKFTDLFQLQDELATAIVQALQVNLNGAAPSSVVRTPPAQSVEAYDLYLQGFSMMLRGGSVENLRLALHLFDQAIARDPTFARAFAARSRARLTFLVRGYPLANAREDAERDAEQALALNPKLGVAHQALGNVSALRGNWIQAESSYRAGIIDDGNDPDVHSGYGMVVLAATGRLNQADVEVRKAYELAPKSANHIRIVALLSATRGLDADALKFAELARGVGETDTGTLSYVYVQDDIQHARYTEAADRVIAGLPPTVRDAGGAEVIRQVYGALADPTQKPAAAKALQGLVAKLGATHLGANVQRDFITDFTMLGALDPAYELATLYLDEFVRSGTGGGAAWTFLWWVPEMRLFRKDSRFQAFVTRMNLIDYWKQNGPPDGCDLRDGTLTCH